jgi:hypothetical protein
MADGFWLRDQREVEGTKKPSDSGKTGNEGIQRIPPAQAGRAGLILLYAEKLAGLVDGIL